MGAVYVRLRFARTTRRCFHPARTDLFVSGMYRIRQAQYWRDDQNVFETFSFPRMVDILLVRVDFATLFWERYCKTNVHWNSRGTGSPIESHRLPSHQIANAWHLLEAGIWLCLWNIDNGSCVPSLQGHKAHISSLAFTSDGETLASGSRDGTSRIWNHLSHYYCGWTKDREYFNHRHAHNWHSECHHSDFLSVELVRKKITIQSFP